MHADLYTHYTEYSVKHSPKHQAFMIEVYCLVIDKGITSSHGEILHFVKTWLQIEEEL